jgi:hypothetical protein
MTEQQSPGPPLRPLDWVGEAFTDAIGTEYQPFFDGWTLGFRVTPPDKVVQWVYLNPSQDDTNGESNVFLYHDEGEEMHFSGALSYVVTYPDPDNN